MKKIIAATLLLLAIPLWCVLSREPAPTEVVASPASTPEQPEPRAAAPVSVGSRRSVPASEAPGRRDVLERVDPAPVSGPSEGRSGLRVLVIGDRRLPLPGAEVRLVRAPFEDPLVTGVTDLRGEAVVEPCQPGDELRVLAKGHVDGQITLSERPWPDPLLVRLAGGVPLLVGDVLDEGRRPVSGARVTLFDGVRSLGATTETEGSFTLLGAPDERLPGEVAFRVEAPGFWFPGQGESVPLEALRATDGRIRLPVLRWASLDVVVHDSDQRPVSQASLRLSVDLGDGVHRSIPGVSGLVLGGTARGVHGLGPGEHRIEQAPPEVDLWLTAEHPDLEPATLEVSRLRPGERREVTISMSGRVSERSLRFLVADPEGNAVGIGRYSVRTQARGLESIAYSHIAPDGTFAVDRPSDDWDLLILAPGYAPLRRSFPRRFTSDGVIELVLDPSNVGFELRVVDSAGVPHAGAVVRVEGSGGTGFDLVGVTDEEGALELVGLDPELDYDVKMGGGTPGTYMLEQKGLVPDPAIYRRVRPGARPLVFRLVRPARLEGHLEQAVPVGSRLQLSWYEDELSSGPPAFTVGAPIEEEGAFAFRGLPPGNYRIWTDAVRDGDLGRPLAVLVLAAGEERRGFVVPR